MNLQNSGELSGNVLDPVCIFPMFHKEDTFDLSKFFVYSFYVSTLHFYGSDKEKRKILG